MLQMVLLTRNRRRPLQRLYCLRNIFFESIKKHSEIIFRIKIHSSTLLQPLQAPGARLTLQTTIAKYRSPPQKKLLYFAFMAVLRSMAVVVNGSSLPSTRTQTSDRTEYGDALDH